MAGLVPAIHVFELMAFQAIAEKAKAALAA
jgi:hypothetical protein